MATTNSSSQQWQSRSSSQSAINPGFLHKAIDFLKNLLILVIVINKLKLKGAVVMRGAKPRITGKPLRIRHQDKEP
jgi:hypothetical protein